uniref:ISN1_0 protein n=1 Tax=Fopius arisanus TaxID=64838 RepID=A0A0C9R7Y1_9HYME
MSSSSLKPTEWESTISIPTTREEFNRMLDAVKCEVPVRCPSEGVLNDIIILFKNGVRLSRRRLEHKITLTTRNILGFHRGVSYPIVRTTAHEELASHPPLQDIERMTHRLVKFVGQVRQTYNKEECEKGERYTLEYEIEYPGDTSYTEILRLESEMMDCAVQHKHFAAAQAMSLENIFACVMSKVQMWHCFDDKQLYHWAYKWNGVKAKMMVQRDEDIAYLWPDAGVIKTQRFEGDVEVFANLCLLVEIMEDRVVIIEVIGSSFDGRIHTTEPRTNIEFLDHLNDSVSRCDGTRIGGKSIVVQAFYPPPKPDRYDEQLHDGFIIVQNDIIIKWKIPTLDVKCIAPFTYSAANRNFYLDLEGEVDAIYEISSSHKILRRRIDRIAPSSAEELETFLTSTELLNACQSTFS